MTDMAPDKGAGVVPIVYMTSFPPFGGGVHSMVTSDCPIPWMVGMETLRCRGTCWRNNHNHWCKLKLQEISMQPRLAKIAW